MNDQNSDDRANNYQGAVKWLAEMELIGNPKLQDIIFGNIVSVSTFIDEEKSNILIDQINKKALILVKYSGIPSNVRNSFLEKTLTSVLPKKIKDFKENNVDNIFDKKILGWKKEEIEQTILSNLQEILPSFKFRIINDEALFNKAKETVMKGVSNDSSSN